MMEMEFDKQVCNMGGYGRWVQVTEDVGVKREGVWKRSKVGSR